MENILDAITQASAESNDLALGLWCLIGVALVFFMQAGFAMVETGFTRAKNAGNIIMKNLMDFALGAVVFWLFGAGLILGDSIGGFIGTPINPFNLTEDIFPAFMFNMVFCATAATIVSGAMAERTKFLSYCIYSLIISMIVYPISAHWIWGNGGWLAKLGFIDFAGSTAVHMVGGLAALVGAIILGPRIGKYSKDKNGKIVSKAIPGHSLTLGALGVFILWFAWYGFNGAAASSVNNAAKIFSTTTIAAATSTVAVMIITWIKYKKPDVSMTLNGSLAGLVAVTAGCNNVSVTGSFFIGLIAAFVVVFGIEFIDQKCHIDDPVGAIGVHGMCGATGTLLVGIFDEKQGLISGFILNGDNLSFAQSCKFFGVQILGVTVVAIWAVAMSLVIFLIIKKTIGLRANKEEELLGLDLMEHNLVSSYADFEPSRAVTAPSAENLPAKDDVAIEKAVEVTQMTPPIPSGAPKLTKICIITRPDKFESLKTALDEIGITGMTMTSVNGCGMQKGNAKYYRGAKIDVHLLPKIKVEVVVSKVPIETVINAAKASLYTGNYGDGKIFVYSVEDAVKVRTGERGYDALQDD